MERKARELPSDQRGGKKELPTQGESIPTDHHSQSCWMLLCDALRGEGVGKKSPIVHGFFHLLPNHCSVLGLVDIQSNAVEPHLNFHELISTLKAALLLYCFQKMFGVSATGLQVLTDTNGKCSCKARGIFIGLILSSIH